MPSTQDALHQLAIGLEYIHSKGLVHRDVKPENALIWVSKDDDQCCASVDGSKQFVSLKWADFGLSKTVKETGTFTMSGIRGTRNWFAPEILNTMRKRKNQSDEMESNETKSRGTVKSDVFSEGLVFGYYLLDGQHLFGAVSWEIETNLNHNNPINIKSKLHQIKSIGYKMPAFILIT